MLTEGRLHRYCSCDYYEHCDVCILPEELQLKAAQDKYNRCLAIEEKSKLDKFLLYKYGVGENDI